MMSYEKIKELLKYRENVNQQALKFYDQAMTEVDAKGQALTIEFNKMSNLIELLGTMSSFQMLNDPHLATPSRSAIPPDSVISFSSHHYYTIPPNPENEWDSYCISFKFSSHRLSQKDYDFLKRYFDYEKKTRENFSKFEIGLDLLPSKNTIILFFRVKEKSEEFFRVKEKPDRVIKISFPLPAFLNNDLIEVINEINSVEKSPDRVRFLPWISMHKTFAFLKNKDRKVELPDKALSILSKEHTEEIEAEIEAIEFISGLNNFLQNYLDYEIFPYIEKIAQLKEKDLELSLIGDFEAYNVLTTTGNIHYLIDLLQEFSRKEKPENIEVSYGLAERYVSLDTHIKLSDFVLDKKIKNFIQQYFRSDRENKPDKIACLPNENFLEIQFSAYPSFPSVVPGPCIELKIYIDLQISYYRECLSFYFTLLSGSDFISEISNKIIQNKFSDKNDFIKFMQEFLEYLKKGNFFKTIGGHYHSPIKELQDLQIYDRILFFKRFCQDFPHFLTKTTNVDLDRNINYPDLQVKDLEDLKKFYDKLEDEIFEQSIQLFTCQL